jgi:hypothetical protein
LVVLTNLCYITIYILILCYITIYILILQKFTFWSYSSILTLVVARLRCTARKSVIPFLPSRLVECPLRAQ